MSTSINSDCLCSACIFHACDCVERAGSSQRCEGDVEAQRRLEVVFLHQYACCEPIGPQGEELVCDTHGFPALISLHLRTLALTKAERYRGTTEQTEQREREKGCMPDRNTGRIDREKRRIRKNLKPDFPNIVL